MNDNHHAEARRPHDPPEGSTGIRSASSVGSTAAVKDSPIAALLEAAGHSRDCIMRVRSGQVAACSCLSHAPSSDDAAVAVGLAIRFARMGTASGVPIPPGVLALLVERVDASDPAAILVWRWLAGRGQVPARASRRPKLRLISGEAR